MRIPSALLLLLAATPLVAQQARPGRIEGVVHDSLAARPLPGAVVTVVPAGSAQYLEATSDGNGRFRLDSLPAGRYTVGFATPFLDSLEIQLPRREVTVSPGERAELAFATPSRATLFAAACPGLPAATGRGAIVGTAVDADADTPLAGATIVVSWNDIGLDLRSMKPTNETRAVEVATDARGHYRVCNLPTDSWIAMQIQQGGRAGTAVRAAIRDNAAVMVQHLSLSVGSAREIATADTGAAVAAADTVTRQLSGTAVVAGRVRDMHGNPIADAQLRVVDGAAVTRSDAEGRFTLGALPAGTQILETRRVGFALGQQAVELRSGRTVTQEVRLSKFVSLDSVRIVAQRSRLHEFERRAGRGTAASELITEAQLSRIVLSRTGDLFQGRVVGFALSGQGVDAKIVSTRGVTGFGGGPCAANVVIDGMQRQAINLVSPSDIAAIEVYRGGAGAPAEYDSVCGAIVIWTKR